jgi:aerobic carbon-monoxide dehydrogenase medium subunit
VGGRLKPGRFEYHAATSVTEAVGLLHELGDEAKVIAGGQSLVPMMALRLASFPHLVDVWSIAEMRGVRRDNGTVTIGAATTDVAIEHDAGVASAVPLLARATPYVGHFQIRNRGTIGGSLAHADPAAEYPAVAVALDAELEVTSKAGIRRIPAGEFFEGFWTTSLRPDELVTAVRFPVWDGRRGFGVAEFARRHGDFAIAGAVAGVRLDDDRRITRSALVLFGVSATPVRCRSAEAALSGTRAGQLPADEVGRLARLDVDEPSGDLHAPPEYRMRVAAAMAAQAWAQALEDAEP